MNKLRTSNEHRNHSNEGGYRCNNYNNNNNNNNDRRNYHNNGNGMRNEYDLDQIDEQKKIHVLNYVYSAIEIARFKYKILEYENDLTLLNNKHYVSANFNGTNSLLVFNKYKNKNYSVLIERKTLSYNPSQVNPQSVKMTDLCIKFDDSIYNGTIMDGTYVLNKRSGNNVFIITDIYVFRGQSLINDNIKHKIQNISAYIDSNLKKDPVAEKVMLTMNKLYDTHEILKLRDDISKSKGFDIKGFVFYPEKSGTRLIFLDNKLPPLQKDQPLVEKKQIKYMAKDSTPIYATLEIRKTEQPDVYHVLCAEKDVQFGRNVIKIKKLGIAFIPDNKTSTYCTKTFANKVNGKALMKCEFNGEKNKWVPLSEDTNAKLPDLLESIEKELAVVVVDE